MSKEQERKMGFRLVGFIAGLAMLSASLLATAAQGAPVAAAQEDLGRQVYAAGSGGAAGAVWHPGLPNKATEGTDAYSDTRPRWTKVANIKANWLSTEMEDGEKTALSKRDIYFTDDNATGAVDSNTTSMTMLYSTYDWDKNEHGDADTNYKTHPVMEFQYDSTQDGTTGRFTNVKQFSSMAVGVYDRNNNRGNDAPLSVYFWSWDGGCDGQTYVTCPTRRNDTGGTVNYASVVRVTAGSPDIYVGTMPAPGHSAGLPEMTKTCNKGSKCSYSYSKDKFFVDYKELTGGEVNPTTGYLYLQTDQAGTLDAGAVGSEAFTNNIYTDRSNSSSSGVVIWDPVSGDYAFSNGIQPGGMRPYLLDAASPSGTGKIDDSPSKNAVVQPPCFTERLNIRRSNVVDAPLVTGDASVDCNVDTTSSNYSSQKIYVSSDMGMDSLGNAYYSVMLGDNASQADHFTSIVKINVAKDKKGNIEDGTSWTPWTYSVVKKIKPKYEGQHWGMSDWYANDPGANRMTGCPSVGWPTDSQVRGMGIMNGKFILGPTLRTCYSHVNAKYPVQEDDPGYIFDDPGYRDDKGNLIYNSTYDDGNGHHSNGRSGLITRMLQIDPLSGEAQIANSIGDEPGRTVNQSGSIDHYSYQAPNYIRDLGSPQELKVISGTIYHMHDKQEGDDSPYARDGNDTVTNAVVALYDAKTNELLATTLSGGTGGYSFILSSTGDYYVRVVQPAIRGVAAHQVWGSTSNALFSDTATSTSVMHCQGGDLPNNKEGKCFGSRPSPFQEPDSSSTDPKEWSIYASVHMGGDGSAPVADFGLSTDGSYGDGGDSGTGASAFDPLKSTRAKLGPVLQSGEDALHLGPKRGLYQDGAESEDRSASAHDGTDDGVGIKAVDPKDGTVGTIPLQGTGLVAGQKYKLDIDVEGPLAEGSQVKMWAYRKNDVNNGDPVAVSELLQAKAGRKNQMTLSIPADRTSEKSENQAWTRFIAVPAKPGGGAFELPIDDTTGFYAQHGKEGKEGHTWWTVPGEVEDYRLTTVQSLVRILVSVDRVESKDGKPVKFQYSIDPVLSGEDGSVSTDSDSLTLPVGDDVTVGSSAIHIYKGLTGPDSKVTIRDETNSDPDASKRTYDLMSAVCFPTNGGSNAGMTTQLAASAGTRIINQVVLKGLAQSANDQDITCHLIYGHPATFSLPLAGGRALGRHLGVGFMSAACLAALVLAGCDIVRRRF
ncbi:hypothetical protein [Bifidobacterium favimelis]|uniref:Prealbumin-like fold domain-containing protein n=1 Tax=Bifidobacterium favimelis TaxID=3122979 RepID=A0ABU8ZP78_9BIFI